MNESEIFWPPIHVKKSGYVLDIELCEHGEWDDEIGNAYNAVSVRVVHVDSGFVPEKDGKFKEWVYEDVCFHSFVGDLEKMFFNGIFVPLGHNPRCFWMTHFRRGSDYLQRIQDAAKNFAENYTGFSKDSRNIIGSNPKPFFKTYDNRIHVISV